MPLNSMRRLNRAGAPGRLRLLPRRTQSHPHGSAIPCRASPRSTASSRSGDVRPASGNLHRRLRGRECSRSRSRGRPRCRRWTCPSCLRTGRPPRATPPTLMRERQRLNRRLSSRDQPRTASSPPRRQLPPVCQLQLLRQRLLRTREEVPEAPPIRGRAGRRRSRRTCRLALMRRSRRIRRRSQRSMGTTGMASSPRCTASGPTRSDLAFSWERWPMQHTGPCSRHWACHTCSIAPSRPRRPRHRTSRTGSSI
mmetsp:Transcript_10429/g.29772  ORF Transcript_10429/g.29772 Transcript_10429/m.29772 type:complete len:253 (-) Transcript_10429:379-1137(-)